VVGADGSFHSALTASACFLSSFYNVTDHFGRFKGLASSGLAAVVEKEALRGVRRVMWRLVALSLAAARAA
jgi:hypothetical protein